MRRTNRNGKILIIGVLVIFISVITANSIIKNKNTDKNAVTATDMVKFLSSFGWEVENAPISEKEVTIPANFSDTYEQYNEIQKKQGYDLTKYRADTVKSYTFKILNHPGTTDGDVVANLLVYDGEIIGGDVSGYAINGFMTGFNGT